MQLGSPRLAMGSLHLYCLEYVFASWFVRRRIVTQDISYNLILVQPGTLCRGAARKRLRLEDPTAL